MLHMEPSFFSLPSLSLRQHRCLSSVNDSSLLRANERTPLLGVLSAVIAVCGVVVQKAKGCGVVCVLLLVLAAAETTSLVVVISRKFLVVVALLVSRRRQQQGH